ncbi:MAG: PIN domain-containing protein [Bacteroidetes bacterium]|jgi:predicted nucleic acid-binding protein|nr:PIN domain-containing protein [Bacteroidota bacterium]
MSDRYFLDTNIIVYSFDERDSNKQETSEKLIKNGLIHNQGVISYQVIQEFINVSTRKFETPLSLKDCQLYVDSIMDPMWEVYSSKDLIHSAFDITERWQYSFYDSLIVAAAIEASCNILYSEDLQHEQKIYSLQILNPFV